MIRALQRQTDPLFRQAGLNLGYEWTIFAVWRLSLEPRRRAAGVAIPQTQHDLTARPVSRSPLRNWAAPISFVSRPAGQGYRAALSEAGAMTVEFLQEMGNEPDYIGGTAASV